MRGEELAELLRDRGFRATGPRLRVYEQLQTTGEHLTADELADRLNAESAGGQDDAELPLSSVYRALAVLDELGIVRATRLPGDEATHWELAHPDEHFHVVCRSCGNVDHHEGTLVAVIDEHLRAGHGFVPEEITVLVHGTCGSCLEAS